jgi:ribulose-5-phosphate 4-epimerase/fuculose-1-phosphate aldolase
MSMGRGILNKLRGQLEVTAVNALNVGDNILDDLVILTGGGGTVFLTTSIPNLSARLPFIRLILRAIPHAVSVVHNRYTYAKMLL